MTCSDAAHRLRQARDKIAEAMEHEEADRPALAQHALHAILPGVVDDSSSIAQIAEEKRRLASAVSTTGLVIPSPRTPVRAWAPR
jgi:hypothetical protein